MHSGKALRDSESLSLMVGQFTPALSVEEALAKSQPFGDCDYIWQRICLHYRRRFELGAHGPNDNRALLGSLEEARSQHLRRILGDPLVRIAIDGSLSGGYFSKEDGATVLRLANESLTTEADAPPLAEGSRRVFRLSDDPWPWIWSNDRLKDDPLGDIFRGLFTKLHKGLELTTPDSRCRDMLLKGRELLHELCPKLAHSALSHVQLIIVADAHPAARFTSLTNPRVPGTIFLSPSVLKTPWQVAELLLHEAMHVKFVDLEHTHSLLIESYSAGTSPKIHPHWNRIHPGNVNEWPINRSLTVLHVYVSLALFFTRVVERRLSLEPKYGSFQEQEARAQIRRAFDRAEYLRGELERNAQCLDFGGRLFVRWLGEILDWFDSSPRRRDSILHLLLDLYNREIQEVYALIDGAESWPESVSHLLADSLKKMARRELDTVTAVLQLTSHQSRDSLEEQRKSLTDLLDHQSSLGEIGRAFGSVRNYVSQSLINTQKIDGMPAIEHRIRNMVEMSGRQLNGLLSVASF